MADFSNPNDLLPIEEVLAWIVTRSSEFCEQHSGTDFFTLEMRIVARRRAGNLGPGRTMLAAWKSDLQEALQSKSITAIGRKVEWSSSGETYLDVEPVVYQDFNRELTFEWADDPAFWPRSLTHRATVWRDINFRWQEVERLWPKQATSEAAPAPQPELASVSKAMEAESPLVETAVKEALADGSSRRGAPTKWTKELYQALLHGLSKEREPSPSLSDRQLVLNMVEKDPEKWNARRGDKKDIARVRDNLCKRLSDAKALTEQTK